MVAMNVWPTDAADGSVANEARWRKMARQWTRTGVHTGIGGEMAQTLAFPNLTVKSGSAWVDGHYCELPGDQVLAVTANGLVVVRFDPAANTAELLHRDGITTPTQNVGGVWEMPVAQMIGSAVTDKRVLNTPSSDYGAWQMGGTLGPYVGAWPPPLGKQPTYQTRSGHIQVATTTFGDCNWSFGSPFPNGVIAVTITPQSSPGSWWWPMVFATSLTGVNMFAVSTQGAPFATGHPPSVPSVWTIASANILFDYYAIGV